KILVVLLFRGQGGSEQISGSQLIQLAPEFGCQRGEICFVLRTSLMDAALHWIFPVNIDAIKNASSFDTWSKMAGNKDLYTGANEIAHMIRGSRAGKALGLPPASEGDEDLQIRIKVLQLLKLMKSAAQLVWTLRVSAAVHTAGSIVLMVQRHVMIRDLPLVIGHVAEGVIQCRKQARRSGCHIVFHRILAGGLAGLSEVANDLSLMAFVFRVERGTKRNHRRQNRYQASTTVAEHSAILPEFIHSLSPRQ